MTASDDKIVAFLFPGGRQQTAAARVIEDEPDIGAGDAQLPLGDRARVVELPRAKRKRGPASVLPQTSEAFDKAWSVFPDAGRRRSSRVVSWPQWVRVASAIGEAQLLGAVEAFARDPVELSKEAGACGFDRWLRWGRWEHWLAVDFKPGQLAPTVAAWDGPPAIWNAAAGRYGEPWARSWLGGCTWDAGRATLHARTGLAAERLARDLKTELAAVGVRRIVQLRDGVEVGRAQVLPNPQPIPENLVASFEESFSAQAPRDWLAICSWDRVARRILSPRDLRPDWAAGPFARWMAENGVEGCTRL